MELPDGFVVSSQSPIKSIPETLPSFVIVSFHTSGDQGRHYEQEVGPFLQAAEKHGYRDRCLILDAGPRPKWREATMLKPVVIRWAFETFATNIVWIDIDARIRGRLDLFHDWGTEDFGIRQRPENGKHNRQRIHWLSGTLFFRQHSQACCELLQEWERGAIMGANRRDIYANLEGDQDVLAVFFRGMMEDNTITYVELPPEYVFVFDIDKQRFPDKTPVIEHFQASRRRRKWPMNKTPQCPL